MRPLIVIVVLSIFFVVTACQMDPEPPLKIQAANSTNTSQPAQTAQAEDDAPRITLAEAKKEFDAGNVFFIDTRAEAAYKLEHIKGAVNISTDKLEARYKEIPGGKKIIAYCS